MNQEKITLKQLGNSLLKGADFLGGKMDAWNSRNAGSQNHLTDRPFQGRVVVPPSPYSPLKTSSPFVRFF
jgi:hypothetical protein